MGSNRCKLLPMMVVLCLISFTTIFVSSQAIGDSLETYIVHLQKPESSPSMLPEELNRWYQSFLRDASSGSTQNRMVHSYRNVVTGFAARLSAEEAKAMEDKEGVVSVNLRRVLPLHTTRTPAFLGLNENLGFWNLSNYGKGVIIGLLDTGIAPEHPSFSDEKMPPPPAKWKGKCEFNGPVKCNNKLIGARNFVADEAGKPPFDAFGHGTHTSSTAAGSPMPGVDFFTQLNGTAIGIAPLAHLAMYKVCTSGGCDDADILAAMDAAVEDGVDILSLSLGGASLPFFNDSIALGAFGAINKGIVVSCSAGNSGPFGGSLSNEAPWILTVGASTVDRTIRAAVVLGNKRVLEGQSFYQPKNFSSMMLPLVYAGANGNESSALCAPGSLKDVDVKGKIVLCERGGTARISKGQEVKDNCGAAMILMNDEVNGFVTEADFHVLPASHVSYVAGLTIKKYINSTSSPMATISFEGTIVGLQDAPHVAMFSSRGPSLASPGILKPDIIGPGVNILAAWPESIDNSTNPPLNMISGTSMSCPHLAGIAALLKYSHPEWSPAAIRSAIMTSASVYTSGGYPITDEQFNLTTVFDVGAGHVNPTKANDPGMVYDLQPDDYIPYLCGLSYSDKEVGLIVQHPVTCSNVTSIPEAQLNYPSFSIKLGSDPQTYTRTVTNVGPANRVYASEIIMPAGVNITVTPSTIAFTEVNQKVSFSVKFSKTGNATGTFSQGYLYWVSYSRSARSPIAIMFK